MIIALAADHAGFALKDALGDWLREAGHELLDLGTNGPERVDYPRFGSLLADTVAAGTAERGIAVCGSGIGISIAVTATRPAAAPSSMSRCRRHLRASTMTPMSLPLARG
jgi:ribose 5-phosphate isomerase B